MQQCTELNVTNRSRAYPEGDREDGSHGFCEALFGFEGTIYGLVAQLVRAPPCHGGGHGFESRLGRFNHFWLIQ